jgi:hypothetical protein
MKRRLRRIANFFAFNLLFFALYLNFIHKDKAAITPPEQTVKSTASVTNAIAPVSHPEMYLGEKSMNPATVSQ